MGLIGGRVSGMKKLGIIGGMGPESTVDYYLRITQGICERMGGSFFPDLTIESKSCFEVVRFADEGKLDELAAYLSGAVDVLVGAGCEVAAIGCNTGHIVFDEVQAASPIPLVSIVDATVEGCQALGCKKPLLLGTWVTMRTAFFKDALEAAGMEVLTPCDEEAQWLSSCIYGELEAGIVRDEAVAHFGRIVAEGASRGADAVILGCTELPMLAEPQELPIPAIDTLQAHIDALIEAALS